MKFNKSQLAILKLALFRKNMGMSLDPRIVKKFWGSAGEKFYLSEMGRFVDNIGPNVDSLEKDLLVKEKLGYVEKEIGKFIISDWVKLVAVSGSIAAGLVKQEDDIDLFIVVKNDYSWIYRAFLMLRLATTGLSRRFGRSDYEDKFCVNFICEERGLNFENRDIFVLHEILYMIPVYNKEYYAQLLGANPWLCEYGIKAASPEAALAKAALSKPGSSVSGLVTSATLVVLANRFFYYLQLLYMTIAGHNPDYKRIARNSRAGRIVFFPKGFRKRVLKTFERDFQAFLKKL